MRKNRKYFDYVTNASNPKEVDILIFGMIGDSWDSERDNPLTGLDFVRTFNQLENSYERINIRINSPGGIVEEGIPIFNAIARSQKDIHIYVDVAMSMAAIISQAGKTVHGYKNSLFLLHSASTIARGNAKDFRMEADILDKYDNSLIQSISARTKMSVEDLKAKYFDYEDHLMSSEEARAAGFFDVIEDEDSKDVPANFKDFTPDKIAEYYLGKETTSFFKGLIDATTKKVAAIFNKQNSIEMTLEQIQALVNGSNIPEDKKAIVIGAFTGIPAAEHQTVVDALAKANSDLEAAGGQIVDLNKKLNDATTVVNGVVEAIGDSAREENADVVALVTDLVAKANDADGNPSGRKKGGDHFNDTDNEEPWKDAPWNKKFQKMFE